MRLNINKKVKAGFTLLELLVVMAITAVLMVTLGSGILNMQSAVKLDNTIRDLKLDIQTTQNQARNSFLTADRSNTSNLTGNFFQGGIATSNISLGWMITFQDDSSSANTIKVIRRSVFFKPAGDYDFSRLRDEIINFRGFLNNKLKNFANGKFECTSTGTFNVQGISQSNATSYTSITGSKFAINCADKSTYNNSEYFETSTNGVKFSKIFGKNPLPSCWDSDLPGAQQSMFFTSGYGEPVINIDTSQPTKDCQLQIQYTGFSSGDVRALQVSKDNGNVELCGSYCGN